MEMKKLLALLLAMTMALALAACGARTENTPVEEGSAAAEPAEAPAAEEAAEETAEGVVKVGVEDLAATGEVVADDGTVVTFDNFMDYTYANMGLTVGIVNASAGQEFLVSYGNRAVEIYEGMGISASVQCCESITEQIEAIENYTAQGVDLIYIMCYDAAAEQAAVEAARAKGIKVFMVASTPNGDYEIDGYFEIPNEYYGQLIAQGGMDWLDLNYPDAEAGGIKTAVIAETSAADGTVRYGGITEVLEADPRIDIVYTSTNSDSIEEGTAAMEEALALDPSIQLVVCMQGAPAIGANSVVTAQKDVDLDSVCIVAGEWSDSIGELMEESVTDSGTSCVRVCVGTGVPTNTSDGTYLEMQAAAALVTGVYPEPVVFDTVIATCCAWEYYA